MTKDEALKILKECREKEFKYTFYTLGAYHTALDMAIKALGRESCEDVISHEAVIEWLKAKDLIKLSSQEEMARKELKALPFGKLYPKTGHWIKYGIPRCGEQHYKCTSCGYYINFGQWGELYTKEFKYCPNCGARMVESQGSEDNEYGRNENGAHETYT